MNMVSLPPLRVFVHRLLVLLLLLETSSGHSGWKDNVTQHASMCALVFNTLWGPISSSFHQFPDTTPLLISASLVCTFLHEPIACTACSPITATVPFHGFSMLW